MNNPSDMTKEQLANKQFGDLLLNAVKNVDEEIKKFEEFKAMTNEFSKNIETTLELLRNRKIQIADEMAKFVQTGIKGQDDKLDEVIEKNQVNQDNVDDLKNSLNVLKETQDKLTSNTSKAMVGAIISVKEKYLQHLQEKGAKIENRQQMLILDKFKISSLKDSKKALKEAKQTVAEKMQENKVAETETKITQDNELKEMLENDNNIVSKAVSKIIEIKGKFYSKKLDYEKATLEKMKNSKINYKSASALIITKAMKDNIKKGVEKATMYMDSIKENDQQTLEGKSMAA